MASINLCGSLIPASVCETIIPKTYDWLKRLIRELGQPVGSLPFESFTCRKEIENYLERMTKFRHDKEATVLGIHGMRGIGRTTLLKKFNDELVRRYARRRSQPRRSGNCSACKKDGRKVWRPPSCSCTHRQEYGRSFHY